MIYITSTVRTMRDMMKPIGAVADKCRLDISPEGLSVKVVDPANVALIDLNLPKEVFHEGEYTVDETLQVGLDVVNYLSLFEGAEDNESAELSVEPYEEKGVQKHRLILKIAGIFEQTLELPPSIGIRKMPIIPTLTFSAEVEVSKEFLKRCFDVAAKAGESIIMRGLTYQHLLPDTPTRPTIIIEGGEEERKFKAEITTGVSITAEAPEVRMESMFSLDYLCDIVNAIGDGEIITVFFDNDCPMRLNFKVLDHGRASFLIAPRVEDG